MLQLPLSDQNSSQFTDENVEGEELRTDRGSEDESNAYSSDEDIRLAEEYEESKALSLILDGIPNVRIKLDVDVQRELGLEVGSNVSSEMGWKQIKKEVLEEYLPEGNPESERIKSRISFMDRGELILVGFMQHLSEEEDTFLVFDNHKAAKAAADIIKKSEAFYRTKILKSFIKYPRPWTSLGSEHEVNILVKRPVENIKDVEIQTVYPIRNSMKVFELRLVDDVRDGYAELLPGKVKFDNILRKRIDMSIQSNPMRISLEQQTDPTFPTNAWSQYLYELKPPKSKSNNDGADENEKVKPVQREIKRLESVENIELSECFKYLLNTLEFNEIDMYRNDYPFITNNRIKKSNVPVLQELFCFVDFSKTSKRFISSIDWHPTFSGVCVVAYSFDTLATTISKESKIDTVQRAVIESNPILIWSFDDILNYKLLLKSPREVLTLKYCPYDGNLVVGGLTNGQIIIWDLKNRLERVELEEILTADQLNYRTAMRSFLAWTKEEDRNVIVLPAAISSLENSHKYAITSIQWMNQKTYITEGGLVKENAEKTFRFFVTTSMDGNIHFWDLDAGTIDENIKKTPVKRTRKLPKGFIQQDSTYKILDGVFKPTFSIQIRLPITHAVMDQALFKYEPINPPKNRKLFMRVQHSVEEIPQDLFRSAITFSTYTGQIGCVRWQGFEFLQGGEGNKDEFLQINYFSQIHGDPVLMIAKNPFVDNLILSVGYSSLAVWQNDFTTSPIFWRKRPSNLTAGSWSKNRPSVFFVTRADGNCEAWDILARTDEPCLVETFGGNILTSIVQHNLSLPQEAIAIGDHNSSLRIALLPTELVKPVKNEIDLLRDYITHEIKRKTDFGIWKEKWYTENKDIIEDQKRAAEDQRLQKEKAKKEMREQQENELKTAEAEEFKRKRREASKVVFDLPERLEKKWDEMNFKRLMKVLMTRRLVDQKLLDKQTKPQKELMRYNEKKKKTIAESFARINQDIAEVRARFLPTEAQDIDLNEGAAHTVQHMMSDVCSFHDVENQSLQWIDLNHEQIDLNYQEILRRARNRRDVLNRSLGGNVEHRLQYCLMREIKAEDEMEKEVCELTSQKTK